jgi:hypothetical protein
MAKSDAWMKVAAICIFGLILLVMCVAAVTGVINVGASYTAVVSVAIFGMIVVILSDRIISVTMSKGQLKVQLGELKRDVRETIKMVRSDMERRPGPTSASGLLSVREEEYAKLAELLSKAESLVGGETKQQSIPDLVRDAQNIGKAMGLLRETMQSCRKIS